jgi:L-asparagine transporter-like permease
VPVTPVSTSLSSSLLQSVPTSLGFDSKSTHVRTQEILLINSYGEIEFGFACLKVATLVGLIIFGLIANLGGIPPDHQYIGGRYWRDEPFNDTFKDLQPVSKARFLGFWAVFTKAAFSYGGIESIGVLAGEAHNPRRTMRMAVRTGKIARNFAGSKLTFSVLPNHRYLHACDLDHRS